MARKPNSNEESIEDPTQDADGNVDQIRQILFGGQMRDYEQRFDALEKRITQNIDRVSQEMDSRMERLSKHMQAEVEKLTEQVKTEKSARIADGKDAGADLQSLKDQMEAGFTEMDSQLATEAKELRLALLDQGDELSAQIRTTHDQVSAELQKEADTLADKKLGREDMAALLTEVALRLNNDFELPKD